MNGVEDAARVLVTLAEAMDRTDRNAGSAAVVEAAKAALDALIRYRGTLYQGGYCGSSES